MDIDEPRPRSRSTANDFVLVLKHLFNEYISLVRRRLELQRIGQPVPRALTERMTELQASAQSIRAAHRQAGRQRTDWNSLWAVQPLYPPGWTRPPPVPGFTLGPQQLRAMESITAQVDVAIARYLDRLDSNDR